ncbi:hypothetical protein [Salipiger mangrovisoli]|uniref:TnsA endonuclease N-terminal domain-containing protein n=1 Tax=Salipiger mangrovisoli TaxID=2865933 RepID=A0ABR9XAS0_9RHOB|nr:hypothetical protein [Salipiger mangrovisoli]MBE9640576.1 hypothetical protein [Salipiger mangrovisoli]
MMKLSDGGVTMPQRLQLARKVAVGAREHATAQITFGPDEGYTVGVDSNTEMKCMLVVMARPNVVGIENQVLFEWPKSNGKTGKHFFDFRVLMADGKRRAIMVKSESRRRQASVQKELEEIAARVPASFADEVVVMTERDIDPIEYFNAEMMHEMRRPDPEADAMARRILGEIVGSVQIQKLVDAIDLGARGFRAVVRLIRSHEIELTNKVRIAHEAFVRRRMFK